jgi:hypothetical protein
LRQKSRIERTDADATYHVKIDAPISHQLAQYPNLKCAASAAAGKNLSTFHFTLSIWRQENLKFSTLLQLNAKIEAENEIQTIL